MRSLILRTLAAIPVLCLLVLLLQDSKEPSPQPASPNHSAKREILRPRPVKPSVIVSAPEPSPSDRTQEDARAEIDELRREIDELDRSTNGAFSKTLKEVLADPQLSHPFSNGKFRLPAGEGAYRLADFLPPAQDMQDDQEAWSFVMAVGIIASSEPGQEVENYLTFDSHRSIRNALFPG